MRFYLSVCICIYSYIVLTCHVLKFLHCKFKQITEVMTFSLNTKSRGLLEYIL